MRLMIISTMHWHDDNYDADDDHDDDGDDDEVISRRLEVVTERLEAAADARGGAPVQPKVFSLSS